MPYNVGLVIRRGLKEVDRTVIRINAPSRQRALIAAEDRIDREIGPDLWSKAVAVTEALPANRLAAA